MLSRLDSRNSATAKRIGRLIKSFLGIVPLRTCSKTTPHFSLGKHGQKSGLIFERLLSSKSAVVAILLLAVFLFATNENAPSGRIAPDTLLGESVTSIFHINAPMRAYARPQYCPNLSGSVKSVDQPLVARGEVLTYTIALVNTGAGGTIHVSDTIPVYASYVSGSAQVVPPIGAITDTTNYIEWVGTVASASVVTITFPVTTASGVPDGGIISNTAWISYEDSLISRTVTVIVDAAPPSLWGCTPSGWVTSTQTPTCTVQTRDLTSGLDVSSAMYRYSKDGGVSWSDAWLSADCSGTDGTTLSQTITATNVPFEQDSETMNLIEFKISDMVGHITYATCTALIDATPPTFGDFGPLGIITATRTPTCTIVVSDTTSGLDVNSAYYQYSRDGGIHWSEWITATCTGPYGTKESQSIIASAVPFNQNSSTSNLIQFRISNVAGYIVSSAAHSVSISVPYTMYLPLIAKSYTHPLLNGHFEIVDDDFAAYWERDGDLSVSTVTTLSNGDSCKSGTYCVLLGSPNYSCKGGIPLGYGQTYQTFGVPLTGNPRLSFDYRIFSYDELNFYSNGNPKFDSFEVYIDNIFDEMSHTLILTGSTNGMWGCNPDDLDITDWKESPEFDLSEIPDDSGLTVDYRGKTVRLSFYVYSREADPRRTVGWFNTWVYLDNVKVEP